MRAFLRDCLWAGLPFGCLMTVMFVLLFGMRTGLLTGICAGLIFGGSIASFGAFQRNRFKSKAADITQGKKILYEGPANHLYRNEGVGGWLYVTPNELIFSSHSVNVNVHTMVLPLSEIAAAEACHTMKIIPNGFRVIRRDGTAEQFVVYGSKEWVQEVQSATEAAAGNRPL